MDFNLLKDLTIVLALAVAVTLTFHRIKVPVVVGFLITGVIAGPHGLHLVSGAHQVELIAEIGIILLFFTIGIEFSLKHLLSAKKQVLLGGTLQIVLTTLAVFGIFRWLGVGFATALMPGFSTFHRNDDGSIVRIAKSYFGPGVPYCNVYHFFDLLKDGTGEWETQYKY